ncbi:MAG: hypothetical protein R3A46_07635 [Thermomicrobiales bacterium]
MVEFLCSQLSASLWSRDVTGSRVDKIVPSDTSHAFLAIDIASFRDLDGRYNDSADEMLHSLREDPGAGRRPDPRRRPRRSRARGHKTASEERGIPVHPEVVETLREARLRRRGRGAVLGVSL